MLAHGFAKKFIFGSALCLISSFAYADNPKFQCHLATREGAEKLATDFEVANPFMNSIMGSKYLGSFFGQLRCDENQKTTLLLRTVEPVPRRAVTSVSQLKVGEKIEAFLAADTNFSASLTCTRLAD